MKGGEKKQEKTVNLCNMEEAAYHAICISLTKKLISRQ